MAHHEDSRLVKIGKDAFALLDKRGWKKKEDPYVYRGPKVITVRETVIDSNQAAQFYGGVLVVDHRIGKPIPKANN